MSDAPPRDEILRAAGRLFTEFGFVKTSTRQIAEAVGVQQGSLFHYFDRKVDILFALLDSVHEPPSRWIDQLGVSDASPAARLYVLAVNDAQNLAAMPDNVGLLYLQTDVRSLPEFAPYAAKRNSLRRGYARLIAEGVEAGQFLATDVETAANIAFGTVEAICTWVDESNEPPSVVGEQIGEAILRALVPDWDTIVAVRSEAGDLQEQLSTPAAELPPPEGRQRT